MAMHPFVCKAVVLFAMATTVLCLRTSLTMSVGGQKKVAILGASGYTGAELMRWNKCAISSESIQIYMSVDTIDSSSKLNAPSAILNAVF